MKRQKSLQILLLFLILFVGTVTGSLLRGHYPEWTIWNNPTLQQGIGIPAQKYDCILTPLFWLAVLGASGLSVTGIPLVPCIVFLRGIAYGNSLMQMYTAEQFPWKEFLLTVPEALLISFVVLFGARESLRFSVQISGLLCEKSQEDEISVKLYIIRFLVLFLFMILICGIQYFLLTR